MSEYNETFGAYEVDPGDAGYESAYDDEGAVVPDEDEGYGYAEDPFAPLRDEYGQIDEDALAALAEEMRAVNNEQAVRGAEIEARQIDQAAAELEREFPVLAEERGVWAMVDAAADLLGIENYDRDELLTELAGRPDIVRDAAEHMSSGEGQYIRMWRQQQNPGHQFWGAGGDVSAA